MGPATGAGATPVLTDMAFATNDDDSDSSSDSDTGGVPLTLAPSTHPPSFNTSSSSPSTSTSTSIRPTNTQPQTPNMDSLISRTQALNLSPHPINPPNDTPEPIASFTGTTSRSSATAAAITALHALHASSAWTLQCRAQELANPFPGIALDLGANRERAALKMHYGGGFCGWRGMSARNAERGVVEEGFGGFSLVRQRRGRVGEIGGGMGMGMGLEGRGFGLRCVVEGGEWVVAPLMGERVEEEDAAGVELGKMRGFVGSETAEWSRVPGSWWAAKKDLFGRARSTRLLLARPVEDDDVDPLTPIPSVPSSCLDLLKPYRAPPGGEAGERKRKLKGPEGVEGRYDGELGERVKRQKRKEDESNQIMGEEWRVRRRAQEKRAGRWTDGTMRQNRMWEMWHWVLDVEDPREHVWDNKIKGGALFAVKMVVKKVQETRESDEDENEDENDDEEEDEGEEDEEESPVLMTPRMRRHST